MHLYRIITEIRAGAEQQSGSQPGQPGLATVWVRSDSQEEALRCAREVIESRRYQSVGALTVFQEESTHASSPTPGDAGSADEEDALASGYSNMKEKALARGDGLFEIWFPPK